MPIATLMFLDSCMRMRIPYAMARITLMEDRMISMGQYNDTSVRWFLLPENTSAMEIAYLDGSLDQYYFKADGSLSGRTIVPSFGTFR